MRRADHRLTLTTRQTTILGNRLDQAALTLGLDVDTLAALQAALMPEEYAPPADHRTATAAPGTVGRVTEMCRRARLGLPLTSPADAHPVEDRPAADVQFVLMIRVPTAKNRKDAAVEARRLLHHPRPTGLPAGCTVETV